MIDKEGIKKLIPHREPFLFLDSVTKFDQGAGTIECSWYIDPDLPFLVGHFPGFPIVPGVILVESMAQAAGVCTRLTLGDQYKEGQRFFLASVDSAKFRAPVLPKDTLDITMEVRDHSSRFWKYTGTIWVGGKPAAETTIMAALAKE